jgi:hypothetical protein
MYHRRKVTSALIGLALMAAVAACGGDDSGDEAVISKQATQTGDGDATATSTTAGGGDRSSTTAAAKPVNRKVGKTGWYEGFAITIDDVDAEPGFGDNIDLTVNLTYENLGNEERDPAEASVQVDGEVVDGLFDTPGIPGKGKAGGTITFPVAPSKGQTAMTPDQAMDKVTLVYGDAGDNQTKLPLAASGKVESIEPKDLTTSGKLVQGQLNIEVAGGSLVPSYRPGEKGKTLLNLRVKITCAADCQASGYNTNRDEFSVTGPDGSSVVADDRSEYCCDAIYPGTVSDDERNILTFVVKSPGTGAYKLTYRHPGMTNAGTAAPTFDFTV